MYTVITVLIMFVGSMGCGYFTRETIRDFKDGSYFLAGFNIFMMVYIMAFCITLSIAGFEMFV